MATEGEAWEAPEQHRRRLPLPLPVLAGILFLLTVAVALWLGGSEQESALPVEEGERAEGWPDALPTVDEADGAWVPLPGSHPRLLEPAAAIWTGREVLVVGAGRFASQNVAFDPRAGTWRDLATSPLAPRARATAVWMPSRGAPDEGELLVWGGHSTAEGVRLADGARYDPDSDRWVMLPEGPLPPSAGGYGVWDGSHVVVGGGRDGGRARGMVARYDPEADRWHELPPPFLAGQRIAGIVQPGSTTVVVSAEGEVAELRQDATWRPLPAAPRRGGTLAAVAAFGVRVAVWEVAADPEVPGRLLVLDVAAARWTEAPPAPIGKSARPLLVPLDEDEVALVGAAPPDREDAGALRVAVYRQRAVDRWRMLPDAGDGLRGDALAGAAWTGHELVVLGMGDAATWRFAGRLPLLEASTDALVHLVIEGQLVTVDADGRRATAGVPLADEVRRVEAVGEWLLIDGAEPHVVHVSGGGLTGLAEDRAVMPAGGAAAWIVTGDSRTVLRMEVGDEGLDAPQPLPHALPAGWRPARGLAESLLLVDDDGGWMLWDPVTGGALREGGGAAPLAAGDRTVVLCQREPGFPGGCPLMMLADEVPERDRWARRAGGAPWSAAAFAPGDEHLALTYTEGGVPRGVELLDVVDGASRRVELPPGPLLLAWHPDGDLLFVLHGPASAHPQLLVVRVDSGDPGPYVVSVDIPGEVRGLAVTRRPGTR